MDQVSNTTTEIATPAPAAAHPSSDANVPATATGVLTIDLDAIIANWRKLESQGVPAECSAVVKANAYGCGTEPVVRALATAGCKTFFVATVE
jgi:alanine racemase